MSFTRNTEVIPKAKKQPSPAYNNAAIAIAQQRVALAGYWLAALLNAIWGKLLEGG